MGKTKVDFERFKIETNLDDSEARELYHCFLTELLEEKEKLQQQYDDKDYGKMAKTVHNIKGISGSYMAADVLECSLELGGRLSEKYTDDVENLVNKLIYNIREAVEEIIDFYHF